jgi:2-haloacid dehalogenase
VLKEQLKNSNLTDYFEQALSIDTIENTNQQQKPIYGQQKTSRTGQRNAMIAAHGWDLAGASHAGLATCFIAREGNHYILYPVNLIL